MLSKAVLIVCHRLLQCGTHRQSHIIRHMGTTLKSRTLHQPVMVREVIDNLYPKDGDVILDMTFGSGGHSEAILKHCEKCIVIALDRDPLAHELALKMSERYNGRVRPLLGCFSDLEELLRKNNITALDGALVDAGCSSMQMDSPERGFSLSTDGPLDMRMDGERLKDAPTAADIVNTLSTDHLIQILEKYGEEKNAENIAYKIAKHRRSNGPIKTTKELATVIASAFRKGSHGRNTDSLCRSAHVATKSFMAIRIFVNDELHELETGLKTVEKFMNIGGRFVSISFHSLEDRIVKRFLFDSTLNSHSSNSSTSDTVDGTKKWLVLKRKVIVPQFGELDVNSRARSAKLRSATRISATRQTLPKRHTLLV